MEQWQQGGNSSHRADSGGSSVSTSLLVRVKSDDPDGWRRLIQLIGPMIYQWCRQAGLQPADAGDVVQEVFRAVIVGIQDFRRERPGDTFRGWLWRITRYKISDHWRRREKQPPALGGSSAQSRLESLPDPSSLTDSNCRRSAHADLVARALRSVRSEFGSKVWQACWMVVIEGFSADDVARSLHMSRGAVYVAKSRVLRRLREELDDLIDL